MKYTPELGERRDLASAIDKLSTTVDHLARVIELQSQTVRDLRTMAVHHAELAEMIWEALPTRKRAALLGVSPRTARRWEKQREIEKLLRTDR